MPKPKWMWTPRGSLFAVVLDTGIAIWCFSRAMQHEERIELWVFSAFFGILATWEWRAYRTKDKAPRE